MKNRTKFLSMLLAFVLLLSLCACSGKDQKPEDSNTPSTADQEKTDQTESTDNKSETDNNAPEEDDTQEAEPSKPEETKPTEKDPSDYAVSDWKELYTSFFSENYDRLMDNCNAGISGIGFIDLDLDGVPELLMFDSGSSAAMGVQFFDIVDGAVTCVSANIVGIGETFGGNYLSDVVVNTNYFKNFRLMLNNETGEQYFYIESANGAMNFYYREGIRFSANNGVLSLESLFYAREVFEEESDKTVESEYKVNGNTSTAEAYQIAKEAFETTNTDTQYSANGVFTWDGNYSNTKDGLLSMMADAADLYTPIV